MGYLNINTVGAFVFLLVVYALWREGPGFRAVEESLSAMPDYLRTSLFGLLGLALGLNLIIADMSTWPMLSLFLWLPGGANLIVHEAGHGLMMFFPHAVLVAGGTLFEVGLPLGLAIVLSKMNYCNTSTLCFFWLSLSLKSVSVYAADAQAQKLTLVGGGSHDWHYMLSLTGLLEYDQWIGNLFLIMAVAAYILALYGALSCIKSWQPSHLRCDDKNDRTS